MYGLMEPPSINSHHYPGIGQQRICLLKGFHILVSESISIQGHRKEWGVILLGISHFQRSSFRCRRVEGEVEVGREGVTVEARRGRQDMQFG